jgi:hypothetical protein
MWDTPEKHVRCVHRAHSRQYRRHDDSDDPDPPNELPNRHPTVPGTGTHVRGVSNLKSRAKVRL